MILIIPPPKLLSSLPIPIGTPLIPFSLPDTEGKIHCEKDYADRKVLVVMFICNHCPYVQAIRQRLINLQTAYDPKDVQLIGINANDWKEYPDDSPEEMKKAVQTFGINFPYLIDETQEVARAYQAQCTPDIFVYGKTSPLPPVRRSSESEGGRGDRGGSGALNLAYHGRVDELQQAIDDLLAGKKLSAAQRACMGCSIKWRTGI